MEFEDKRPKEKRHAPFEITAEMLESPVPSISEIVAERIRKRDEACSEEMAAVYRKYFPDAVCTGRILRARLSEMLAAEQRLRESDCKTCGKYPTCHHNHGRHGVVRINCPLWRPKG